MKYPAKAILHLDGYAGRRRHEVVVESETKKRFRITSEKELRLPGLRVIDPGKTVLVPKYAITFIEEKA